MYILVYVYRYRMYRGDVCERVCVLDVIRCVRNSSSFSPFVARERERVIESLPVYHHPESEG